MGMTTLRVVLAMGGQGRMEAKTIGSEKVKEPRGQHIQGSFM